MARVKKYKRRPLLIEAVVFDGWNSVEEIRNWVPNANVFYVPSGAVHTRRGTEDIDWDAAKVTTDTAPEFLLIATPDGEARVDIGYYILKSEEGDAYVVDPPFFEQTYELRHQTVMTNSVDLVKTDTGETIVPLTEPMITTGKIEVNSAYAKPITQPVPVTSTAPVPVSARVAAGDESPFGEE